MDFTSLAKRVFDLLRQRDVVQRMDADEHWRNVLGRIFPMPTQEQLADVLREAFFATLLPDEGRPTRFVLSFLHDDVVPRISSGQIDLAPPQVVTRAAIRRLAPTAPPRTSLLRLQLGDEGVRLSSILTFAENWGRPVSLSVAGHRPGVLSVSFNNQKLLYLHGDEVTALDGAALHFDPDSAATRLALHQTDGSYQVRMVVAGLLLTAVQRMKRAGHGGAFWVLPATGVQQFEGEYQRVAGTGDLFQPIGQTLDRVQRGPEVFGDARQMAAENLLRWAEDGCVSDTLSQLAATDGAVLMTMEPRIVGFGAFVHTQPPEHVRRRRDGSTETIPGHALGGGRHRSAAAYCAGGVRGERAALVVSQDGAATMFFSVSADAGGLGALGAEPLGVFAARVEAVGRGFAADE